MPKSLINFQVSQQIKKVHLFFLIKEIGIITAGKSCQVCRNRLGNKIEYHKVPVLIKRLNRVGDLTM